MSYNIYIPTSLLSTFSLMIITFQLQLLTSSSLLPLQMDDYRNSSSNLFHKLRTSLCLSCCFPTYHRESLEPDEKPRLIRASSSWLRSRAHELPEFKEKCRSMFNRIARRRKHSVDFGYDPLSYALNFDEGAEEDRSDEFPLRNFSTRLPASPNKEKVVVSREIAAFS